jgi:lactobin A/cerein 7B family class IIb bacteriocin
MTTFESLRMDGNAGAFQALDQAELAAVDGGIGPLALVGVGLVFFAAGFLIGVGIKAIASGAVEF